ncbi:MAG: hypothetical protein JHC84_04485 [Solirubrobacteraceae bacterium]|nr:hypothetical protein [Solirubrobacteraceae bacterium]
MAAALIGVPGTALAASLDNPQASPANLTAGAHSNFTVQFNLSDLGAVGGGGDDIRSLDIDLPAGLVGDTGAATLCPFASLQADACPASSTVGSTNVNASVRVTPFGPILPVELDNQTINGSIFLVPTRGTEPARLGIVLRPTFPVIGAPLDKVVLESPVRVRTPGDGGLTASIRDIPTTQSTPLGTAALQIRRLTMVLFAQAGSGQAFMTNPTSCAPATTRITAGFAQDTPKTGTASFTPTGCTTTPFTPEIAIGADPAGADSPTAASVTVSLPFNRNVGARAQSQPRRAVVRLPEGFELAPTVGSANDLQGCSDAAFGRTSPAPSTCPAASQIGTVRFSSPLIAEPLTGRVFLADPAPGAAFIRAFIVAEQSGAADALRIKLQGDVTVNESTGQVTTVLEDIPPLPFTTFTLTFRGGQHAVFSSPRSCGEYRGSGTFSPHSGGPDANPTGTVVISGDCPDPNAFGPSASVSTSPTQAGADAVVSTLLERPDRQARLRSMQVSLPPGLLGRVASVPQCDPGAAAAGACPADTRVGTVTATAGAGPAPLTVQGPVYLTQSLGGSFAGLSIVVPAKVGPLDLGNSVTLAKLFVRPSDQGLDVIVDEVPLRLKGIALSIRSLNLALDRPGFTFNATNCAAMPVRASFGSDLGGSAVSESGYQATGCEALPFAPKIEATLTGSRRDVNENGHPGLTAVVSQIPGEANTSSVAVTLPAGVAADPDRLRNACPLAKFEAGACPAASTIGTATAVTPLLNSTLNGNVVFVLAPGSALPQLRLQLRGQLPIDLLGKVGIGSGNRLVNEFGGIPDVPLSRFELKLAAGAKSPLLNSRDLCSSNPRIAAAFRAHSGKSSARTITPFVEACAPKATVRVGSLRRGRPAIRLRVDGSGKKVTKVRLKVPSGLALNTRTARRLIRVQAAGARKGTKATIRVYKSRVDVTIPRGGADRLNVLLRAKAVRVGTKLRRRSNARLQFRLDVSQPGVKQRKTNLRTRPVRRV